MERNVDCPGTNPIKGPLGMAPPRRLDDAAKLGEYAD
jgi:hypothetical protein